jgi:hypothetical protein
VISDEIRVKVTVETGQGFLDRMIALVSAERQKTNEIALLLVSLTIIFLIGTIPGFTNMRADRSRPPCGIADHASETTIGLVGDRGYGPAGPLLSFTRILARGGGARKNAQR